MQPDRDHTDPPLGGQIQAPVAVGQVLFARALVRDASSDDGEGCCRQTVLAQPLPHPVAMTGREVAEGQPCVGEVDHIETGFTHRAEDAIPPHLGLIVASDTLWQSIGERKQ